MYTLDDRLSDVSINELYRAWNTNKDFIVVDIHVFNVGARYDIICTNNYIKYENISDDGYSFILSNDYEINATIEAILLKKLNNISSAWTIFCYDYSDFKEFLKSYKITEYKYSQLLELQKNSNVNY